MQINFVQTTWTHSNTIDFGSIPCSISWRLDPIKRRMHMWPQVLQAMQAG